MSRSDSEDFDLLAPETWMDPYALYQRMRKEAPIYWSDQVQSWVIVRYRDVFPLLRDPYLSTSRPWRERDDRNERGRPDLLALRKAIARRVAFLDPPDPIRIRALADHVFTPSVIARMRPRLQMVVNTLVRHLSQNGQIDIIRDLARPLPVMIITALLGAAPEDYANILSWTSDIAVIGDECDDQMLLGRAQRSLTLLTSYYDALIADLAVQPDDPLLTFPAAISDVRLTEAEEMLATAAMFIFAGHTTTQNLIGNALATLLRHPEQFARLKEHPTLTIMALEELMRYESPIQHLNRVAVIDTEVEEKVIQAGQTVLLSIGSANRDPEQFRNADQLDIARANNRHLTFGQDAHFSFSAALTRLEGQIVVETLVRRLVNPRLVSDQLDWKQDLVVRGLLSLPIVFDDCL